MPTAADIHAIKRQRIQRWLIVIATLLAAFIILVLIRAEWRPMIHSSAHALRPNDHHYQRAFAPQPMERDTTAVNPLVVTLTTNGQEITISHPTSPQPYKDLLGSAKLHSPVPSARIQADGLTVELTRIGFAALTHSNVNWLLPGQRLGAVFFTPNLVPYEPGRLHLDLSQASERQLECGGNFPAFSFDFRFLGPRCRLIGGQLFDARTHSILGELEAVSLSNGEQRLLGKPFLWHDAPVLLAIDVAVGPMTADVVEPHPNVVFKIGDVSGQIVLPGSHLTSVVKQSTRGRGRENLVISTSPSSINSFIYYRFSHHIDRFAYELVYLNGANEPQPIRYELPSGSLRMMVLSRGIEPGDRIGVARYDHRKRLVFQLPALPGVMEINSAANNLFAAKVPYLKFKDPAEQMAFILVTAQLGTVCKHPVPGPAAYPREFTNATIAEVLHDYSTLVPGGFRFESDQTHFALKEASSTLRTTLRALLEQLGWL